MRGLRAAIRRPLLLGVAVASALAGGCSAPIAGGNPSFAITIDGAKARLDTLEGRRGKLERPLVILGGFLDVGFGPMYYQNIIQKYVDAKIIRITFSDCYAFDQCRARVSTTLDSVLGSVDDASTVEVDVIGQSMGGLVALYSALEDPALGKRLKIRRLFTVSSPLQGAKLAELTSFDVLGLQKDMRPGSELYHRLARTKFDFPIYSYTRLEDTTVGEEYASLPGRGVWWVENVPGQRAHIGVFADERVLLDIILRLRGEKPITTSPPAPLPVPPAAR